MPAGSLVCWFATSLHIARCVKLGLLFVSSVSRLYLVLFLLAGALVRWLAEYRSLFDLRPLSVCSVLYPCSYNTCWCARIPVS